jgi:uncharacterized membrane protein YbaN (DUF454 family)
LKQESVSFLVKVKKGAYFIVGTLALILGIIGAFLPVLPTTPLILLAAGCYIRSSKRFYEWLISNDKYGKTIEDYHTGRGITKNTKIRAIGLMWLMITISVYFFITSIPLIAFLYLIAISVSVYLYRQPTIEEYITEAQIGE